MVPPAVKPPGDGTVPAGTGGHLHELEVLMPLAIVLALAAVELLPATAAARESVQAAAPEICAWYPLSLVRLIAGGR